MKVALVDNRAGTGKRQTILFTVLICVAMVGSLCALNSLLSFKIYVKNANAKNISNVQIIMSGGTVTFPKILPSHEVNTPLLIRGEGGQSISFTDHTGRKHSHSLDHYFETGWLGNMTVIYDKYGEIQLIKKVDFPVREYSTQTLKSEN